MNIIEILEKEQLRDDIPKFGPGDTVRVHAKIVEGTRNVHSSPHFLWCRR